MNNPACNTILQQEQASLPRPVRQYMLAGLLLLLWVNPGWSKDPACPTYAQMRPLLNSERIQACFGSYGVEVLEQQGNLRISSLYSLDGEARITRTLAISEFATDLPAMLQEPYRAIGDGASMGSLLEAAGWQVDKRLRYLGEVPVSTGSGCMSGLGTTDLQPLALQIYDLWVLREGLEVRFALLAELHDPRYLTLRDLRQVYPDMTTQFQQPDQVSEKLLLQVGKACLANE